MPLLSHEIKETYQLNWHWKTIKYLSVTQEKHPTHLYKANYDQIRLHISRDLEKWCIRTTLDCSWRIEIIKMNIPPRLYFFQSIPVRFPQEKIKEVWHCQTWKNITGQHNLDQ